MLQLMKGDEQCSINKLYGSAFKFLAFFYD